MRAVAASPALPPTAIPLIHRPDGGANSGDAHSSVKSAREARRALREDARRRDALRAARAALPAPPQIHAMLRAAARHELLLASRNQHQFERVKHIMAGAVMRRRKITAEPRTMPVEALSA